METVINIKTKTIGFVVLALIALGSIGCSSSPRVYYWRGKAYAKNPETGEITSRKYKVSEGRGYPMYTVPTHSISMSSGFMSGYKPNIDCSNIQIPCNIK